MEMNVSAHPVNAKYVSTIRNGMNTEKSINIKEITFSDNNFWSIKSYMLIVLTEM
jgi:hypothetical protein